jgi:hypothetical protein
MEAKAREYVSSYDKLTPAEIVQVLAGTATDNTTAIQNLFNEAGSIFIDKGTYVVNPLTMVSNTVLWMHPEAKLLAKAGYGANDRLLNISGCDNVTIHGNHATIQMLKAEYVSGEQRHCVNLTGGSANVSIYDLHCIDSGGDGFYVGGTAPVENILLMNCYADNNRRQGLSISNVIGCKVIGGEYKNTIGTLPEAGIDIEPNPATGYYIQDVLLQGVRTSGNNGAGIMVTPTHLDTPITVTIRDCVSSDSEGLNGSSCAMFITTSATGTTGKIRGKITVDNCKIINPAKNGFCVGSWSEYAPELEFIDCYVLNPAYDWASASASVTFQNGFRNVTASGDTTGSSFGYYKITNFVVEDDRGTIRTNQPVYITNAGAAAPLTDIEISGVKWIAGGAWTSGALTPVFLSSTLCDNVTVDYGYNYLIQSGSTTIPIYCNGATLFASGSATYTLPLAANSLNAEFSVYIKNTGTINFTPNAADVIDIYSGGVAGNAAVSSTVGSFLKVKAIESGRWAIQTDIGTWA